MASFSISSGVTGYKGRGRTLLNVGSINTGTYAFLNYMKGMSSWRSATTSAHVQYLDNNGIPTASPPIAMTGGISMPPKYLNDTWVIKWDGTAGSATVGGMQLSATGATYTVSAGSGFVASNSGGIIQLKGANGTVEFVTNVSQLTFTIRDSTSTGGNVISALSNIRFYRKDQESYVNAGEIFNPDYINNVVEVFNPRVIRMLGWNFANGDFRSRWSYEPDANNITYSSTWYAIAAWAGTASYSSDNYTCSAPSDWPGLVDGATVHVYLANANTTTTPTLAVGGTAAKTIVFDIGSALTVGAMPANNLYTFDYDSVLDKWMLHYGGFGQYVPVSMQVAFCNKIGRDLWTQYPYRYNATEAALCAAYVRDNLLAGLNWYSEYTNEFETQGASFKQSFWGPARASAMGLPGGSNDLYGLKLIELHGASKAVWPTNQLHRLKRVGSWVIFRNIINVHNLRFRGQNLTLDASGNYTSVPGNIVYNYTAAPNRPIDYCDVVSNAMYWRGGAVTDNGANYITLRTPSKTITGITKANPGVVTSTNHGLSNGDRIYLDSGIAGMTQIANCYATVANAATSTFELSAIVNSSGVSVSSDTTSYGTFTSGVLYKIEMTSNNTLVSYANQYATGTAAERQAAIDWFDADVRSGNFYYADGTVEGAVGSLAWFKSGPYTEQGSISTWPQWVSYVCGSSGSTASGAAGPPFNKPLVMYEGGYDGVPLSYTRCLHLGLPVTAVGRIAALIWAWRRSDKSRATALDYNKEAIKFENIIYPGWSIDIALGAATNLVGGANTLTASFSGTTMTVTAVDGYSDWASGTTYGSGALVIGSNRRRYTSTGAGNIGNDPTTDGGVHWTDRGDSTTVYPGEFLYGTGIADGTVVLEWASGNTNGVNGDYIVSKSQSLSSGTVSCLYPQVWANIDGDLFSDKDGTFKGISDFNIGQPYS